jgi:hypothetical protein
MSPSAVSLHFIRFCSRTRRTGGWLTRTVRTSSAGRRPSHATWSRRASASWPSRLPRQCTSVRERAPRCHRHTLAGIKGRPHGSETSQVPGRTTAFQETGAVSIKAC